MSLPNNIPTIIVGNGNWGIKQGNLLGYSQSDYKLLPREFAVTRGGGTNGTFVGSNGLIQTAASGNLPRIDFYGGSPALLVEPSATNLALQSEAFNTTWNNASNNLSISTNVSSTLDPAGGNTADLLTVVSGSTQSELSQFITVVSGTSYVFSIFGKKGSGATDLNSFRVLAPSTVNTVTINWDTGVLTQTGSGATSQNYGNGWWRVIIPFTASATSAIIQAVTYVTYTAGISSLRWGAQLEQSSVATSYIPTTTGTVTRNADLISVTGVAGLIGQTEGTVYVEVDVSNRLNGTAAITLAKDANVSNRVVIYTASSNRWRANYTDASGTVVDTSAANDSQVLGVNKLAFAYGAGGNATVHCNGSLIITLSGTSTFVQELRAVFLGSGNAGSLFFNNRIRAVSIYQTRLPNTTTDGSPSLQSITTL